MFRRRLDDFIVEAVGIGSRPSGKELELARRAASLFRFDLETGKPEMLELAQQLLSVVEQSPLLRPIHESPVRAALLARELAERIEGHLLAGRIRVEERRIDSLTERLADLPDVPPLPPAQPQTDAHTFEITFVDEVGKAIARVDAEFVADGTQTRPTNAAGIALLEGMRTSTASVTLPDPEALAAVLDPRWESFRPGAPEKSSNSQDVVFRGKALGPIPIKAEVPNRVVIKPPLGKLYAELWDKRGRVLHANRTVQITGPQDFEATTDEQGRLLQEDVFPGNYQASVALDFFENDPDRIIDIADTTLVVLDAEAEQPQVRMLGAAPFSVLARLNMFFNTNKTFLLPTTLPAIRELRRLYIQNAPCSLLVVGHADTAGGPAYNDKLSLDRAEATIAYLKDDVEAWYEFYNDSDPKRCWGKVEDHLMITAMPDFRSKPKGEDEVEFYQRTRKLEVDGKAGKLTRHALIAEYMSLDGVSLTQFVGEIDATAHGCGENFPLDDSGEELDAAARDQKPDPIDRRVELYFFDDEFGISPKPPSRNSKPGSPEYRLWRERVAKIVDLTPGDPNGPKVTFVELADGHFRTDSAVVLPEGEEPSDGSINDAPTSAGLIGTALRFNSREAGHSVLVAGHTDTSAGDEHNQALSEERAKMALALLVGDRDSFVSIGNGRHKTADIKQILASFARSFADLGFDCAPKKVDDNPDKYSVKKFQEVYNQNLDAFGSSAALTPSGTVDSATWGAFFDCYELALQRELSEDASGIAELRSKLVFADDERRALGFGEHFPIEELGVDQFRSQTNRRVEILFFPPGEAPDLAHAQNDPETTELYLPGFFQRKSLTASPADVAETKLGTIFMELFDVTGRARLARRPYTISGPSGFSGTTDEAGRLKHEFVRPGDYELTISLDSGDATSPALVLEADDEAPQVRLLGEVKNVTVARLIGLFFDTNKSFLLPAAIPAIRSVKALYDENPGSKLLVVGHTDTAGTPKVNDPLSLERAKSILSYLTDKADDWIVFYDGATPTEKRWGDKEDRDMVSRLPDASARLASETPMQFFRRTRNQQNAPLRDVRRALIAEYMGLDETSLPADIQATAHGCGENFPAVGTADGQDLQENRRVELFFFEGEIEPPPPGPNSGPKSPEYPQWSASAIQTIDLRLGGVEAQPLFLSLFVGERFPDLRGSVEVAGASGKALRRFAIADLPPDDEGNVVLKLETAGLPDPVSIRRVTEEQTQTLIGPCSLSALMAALQTENFELAGSIGYPKAVSS